MNINSSTKVIGISYVLGSILEDSSNLLSDNTDWNIATIEEKTGIKKRHISGASETAVDLACLAANKLLISQDVDRLSIDGLILVTQSPDYKLPTSACILQNMLGLGTNVMSFDINLGCSGFIYGLANSIALMQSGFAKRILLICGDTYSKYIDKSDRTCRPIFSDGASAILLDSVSSCNVKFGPFVFGSDGSGAKNLIVENSGARESTHADSVRGQHLFMDGAKVFMFTMSAIPKLVNQTLNQAGIDINDISIFIFHQASKVVLDNIAKKLNIPQNKMFCNIENIGNTVSATIPIALKDAHMSGAIKSGDLIFLAGFGVGYSWGATIMQWNLENEKYE
jgi:3-oxoacyl-[acyl-carrier-protein] synthase-3